MTEAVQPDQVRSAEQIELSAREAASGVTPRDAGSWASKVDRLDVEQRAGVRGTNVAGRRLTGPVQGFGKMWQKTYRLALPGDVDPGAGHRHLEGALPRVLAGREPVRGCPDRDQPR